MTNTLITEAEELMLTYDSLSTSFLMRKFRIPRKVARDLLKILSKRRRRFMLITEDLLEA